MIAERAGRSTVLLDTNVLVYAYDRSERRKQEQARALLEVLATAGTAALSTQVLGEFFTVITRKIKHPLGVREGLERLEHHARIWPVLEITETIVLQAARAVRDHQMHFWDAQLWAVARLHDIPAILSEDFGSGSVVDGVGFLNPFLPGFRISDWA